MEKRKTAFEVNKKPELKHKIYYGQTIEMQRYVDFVWFVEYTNKVLENFKQTMVDKGEVSIKPNDIGILVTTMEIELVQQFTNVDLNLINYSDMIDSDFLDTIVWAFENYQQVLNYFMNSLQILNIQTVLMDLVTNLPDADSLIGDISKASHLLDDMTDEQKELLMNVQLNNILKDKVEQEKTEKKEEQKKVKSEVLKSA